MTNPSETLEDEYEEFDEFDEDEDERGLSGFAVLIMGLVMIGAFFSVVWIAYQKGIQTGEGDLGGETPYVAAEPEPIKIETAEDAAQVEDREVYDVFDGDNDDPVTVLAQGPEEPVTRTADDPIADNAEAVAVAVSDEARDNIADIARDDAVAFDTDPNTDDAPVVTVTTPSLANTDGVSAGGASTDGALSGTHVVQVGAFRSADEAGAQWRRMGAKLGDYLDGKSDDVERADLGDRGVYHRLRIGPFISSQAASQYCAGLKERGQDCLVKKI